MWCVHLKHWISARLVEELNPDGTSAAGTRPRRAELRSRGLRLISADICSHPRPPERCQNTRPASARAQLSRPPVVVSGEAPALERAPLIRHVTPGRFVTDFHLHLADTPPPVMARTRL
ncbi:hypothetical protein SKAU_G00401290 [Synaphobranchus kaupii]|uniref:Uncharacterized protein n=1 Tax=Synaphobranchus kaupii TaxID=118154 RepID=A0A9Q1E957_SYNKA|nr:hypothetical protein SKAU_G00401290 [Synaphobranchus kaupii]